ncbi:hypothetical protein AQ505_17225 [Pedobacter sp. PACM 27299]|uniref:hypothetical protein n=1 Tax=Pedobacter sp. PACM 27299 TaxID=1727164 RepID=UPI0007058ED5|nr:hypothetical protein [Pedobacter sp. PACM 27299]ALL07072.1 hypothetical protein AQ505_17225 [Pedobacter sp. PACM 27299]
MAARALAYTIDLLQYKIITYIRLNSALNSNITYKTRFVDVTEHAINFNFYEFNEAYQEKFIEPDFEAYSAKFIEFIKPVFQDFIKEIHYGGYTFRVSIKFNAERFEKVFSVLSPGNPQ